MLVLTRKTRESIQIGPDITVTVVRLMGNMVRLGITAPPDVTILRDELGEITGPRKTKGGDE